MTTPAIQRLTCDHERRALILDLLEAEMLCFEQKGQADWRLLREIMEFYSEYVNRFHHPLEDAVLERMLRRDPGCKELVNQVFMEHTGLLQETGLVSALLDRIESGERSVARDEIVSSVRDFVAWNRIHMRREDNDIFPRAEASLRDEDWTAVGNFMPQPDNDPLRSDGLPAKYPALFRRLPARLGGTGNP